MIFDSLNFAILILTLCTVQSILGIGVLVIGTPILLILNYEMVEIMFILLPISITTSIINIVILKFKKFKNYYKEEKEIAVDFFLICFPSIIIGIIALKIGKNIFKDHICTQSK